MSRKSGADMLCDFDIETCITRITPIQIVIQINESMLTTTETNVMSFHIKLD